MSFMHPVKSRKAISAAYFDHGVKTFSFDTHEELAKILDATGQAKDLNLIVRMGVQAEGAAYSLSGKFGVDLHNAPALLLAARRSTQDLMGVSFHVGSQCMRPTAYQAGMAQVSRSLVRAGVFADVDVALFTHVGNDLGVSYGEGGGNGLISVQYNFKGESAHAAGNPWRGRSALDAVELMDVGWNFRR